MRSMQALAIGLMLLFLTVGSGSAEELVVQVPESGPISARVHQLWQETRPIIEQDARAGQNDAYYQARRGPLFEAWVKLQVANSLAEHPSEDVGQLIPRILETIDQVYGFPGFTEAERINHRQNVGRSIYLLKDVDKRISRIP
jgi:hypothetical protein